MVMKNRPNRRNSNGANMFESIQALVQKWTQLGGGSVNQTFHSLVSAESFLFA